MKEAIQREMEGLAQRGTFEIVCCEDIGRQGKKLNGMGGRFVLAIKNFGTGKEACKARFAVQGHSDVEKSLLVHNTTT